MPSLIVPSVVLLAGGICAVVFLHDQPRVWSDHSLVVQANNQFAFDLYQKLRTGQGNLFFSPCSLFTALSMACAGARGTTEEQMAEALSLPTSARVLQKVGVNREPMSTAQFAEMSGGLIKNLNAGGTGGKYELNVANALWGQKGDSFVPDYIKLVETEYEGKLQSLDFNQAAQAAGTINAWVEKQTRGKITGLISPDALGPLTRLVLTNAVYFKGKWAKPFSERGTMSRVFKLLGGTTKWVSTMQVLDTFGHVRIDDLQILDLPYVGNDLSMVVLLPKETDGIARLEERLTSENLSKWLRAIRQVEVSAFIPKFEGTSTYNLRPVLVSLGMTDAFSPSANFSGMVTEPNVPYTFISGVVHKAYVDVYEKGTEAAAATGVTVTTAGREDEPKREVFIADHPFIYLIRDRHSGCILFIGRLMDPAS